MDQLLTALHLVITKLKSEPASARSVQVKGDDTSERLQLRMLVHTRLCGTLIGKGGATIRSFNEDSNATFNISPPPTIPGLTERVVRIAGDVDELMRAVALLVTKLSENPDYHLLTDANLVYSARFLGAPPQGRFASPGGAQGDYQDRDGDGGRNSTGHVSVTIGIPESRVGNVIGKQGAIINQIKEVVNVTIRISKKGEHLPGTDQRACYISGPPDSVEIAHRLIQQKIEGR